MSAYHLHMTDATRTAQAAAETLFALPVGTRVKLTLQNDRTWDGEITEMRRLSCDLAGKRGASRSIIRNNNTHVGFFVGGNDRSNAPAVMAIEVLG